MRNESWVWPKVGKAGTSGAGAVPLRSAQMMDSLKLSIQLQVSGSESHDSHWENVTGTQLHIIYILEVTFFKKKKKFLNKQQALRFFF